MGLVGLLLPVLYAVSYISLMEPRNPIVVFGTGPWEKQPHYRVGGSVTEWFYSPLHSVDAWVRPKYWEADMWYVE